MKFLIKLFCLLSLVSSFGFTFDLPSVYYLGYYRDNSLSRYDFHSSVDALLLLDDFIKIDNDVYRADGLSVDYVNLSLGISWGGFQFDSRNLILYSYFSSFEKKDAFCRLNGDAGSDTCFDRKSSCGSDCKDVTFSYVKHYSLSKFTTCNAGENFNTSLKQCVPACPAGQSWDNETEKCKPDIKRPDWCPEPMKYNVRNVELLLRTKTVEECLPDPNIDFDECKKRGMKFFACDEYSSREELNGCMKYPMGCYSPETINRMVAETKLDNDLFIMGGFMIPLPINAIKNGLASLGSFFKGLFSGGAKPTNLNLLEYRPQLVDIKATKAGPEPVFNFNPVDDNAIAFNNAFRETGNIDSTASTSTNLVKSPQVTADVSPNLRKFDLPKDASVSKIENNTIVTAKLKDMSKPIPTKDITVPNEVKNINLDYDLNTMFKASDKPTPNLPMTIKQTSNAGNKSTYKGNIVTPDNSVIDVEVIETTTQTGSRVQDVTYSYTYKTPKGSSKFSTGYVNTIDSSNKVTNSIPKDSTSSSSGSSSNSGSGGSSSTTTPNQPTQSIDLSSLEQALNRNNAKLDSINDTLTSIKNQQLEQWNYEPNVNIATSFSALQSELAKFDVSVDDAFDFLDNFNGDINNLMSNFNESLDIFNKGIDAPDIPKGTCPFYISGPTPGSQKNNLFDIDPCRIVTPYRSILTLFFTIWFIFEIIMFSLKYLFRVGGDS